MSRLIFLIILFGVGYLLYHLYGKKLRSQGPKGLIKPALIAALILLVLAVATGRANAIFAVIGGLLAAAWRIFPVLVRFYPQLRQLLAQFAPGNSATSENTSQVTTASLDMTLDHSSGRIDGKITAGQFNGRKLSQLSFEEITQFYKICEHQDPEALRLLQAFIEREFPGRWQAGSAESGGANPAQNGSMSVSEAWEILGLNPGAEKAEIVAAHKKLMGRLHPDKGGSNFLASRVNQAKDCLIAELQREQEKRA